MGIKSKQMILPTLTVAFTLATAAAFAQGHPGRGPSGPVDLSDIQKRFEQIERESRLNLTPKKRDGFLDENRTITRAQERTYQQITKLLSQNGGRLDLMREQIIQSMALQSPETPMPTIRQQANEWIRNYMLEETAGSQTPGTKTPMPEQFTRTVRGCTQDGQIYQMSYNIAVDMTALGAFGNDDMTEDEASVLETQVMDTNRHFSGVTGTADYLETLRALNESMNYSMQRLTGGLIDSLNSQDMNSETYNALLTTIINSTEDGIAENYYGVDIDILTKQASRLPGECSPAFNNTKVEKQTMYMPDPPAASSTSGRSGPPRRRAATGMTRGAGQTALSKQTPASPSNNMTGNPIMAP